MCIRDRANVAKMAAGLPLDDTDRAGWLAELARLIAEGLARDEDGVIACSALKRQYRDVLCIDRQRVRFVYLRGDFAAIWARLQSRKGHFMKAPMLQSQFDALEEPEGAVVVDTSLEPVQVIDRILEQLMARSPALGPVSYTHLDAYKRQQQAHALSHAGPFGG